MRKLYKVVQGEVRISSMGYLFPEERFILCYNKGTIVEAPRDTVGIFCFSNRATADAYAQYLYHNYAVPPIVIEVEPLAPVRQLYILGVVTQLTKFYRIRNIWKKRPPFQAEKWEGTVLCSKVWVVT